MEELRTQTSHRCVSRFSGLGASAFYPQLLTSQLTPCWTEALSGPWPGTEDLPWTSASDCTWQPPPSPCPTMDAQMPPGISSSGGSPTCKSPTSCGLSGLLPGCICSSRLLSSLGMAPPMAYFWVCPPVGASGLRWSEFSSWHPGQVLKLPKSWCGGSLQVKIPNLNKKRCPIFLRTGLRATKKGDHVL